MPLFRMFQQIDILQFLQWPEPLALAPINGPHAWPLFLHDGRETFKAYDIV